MKRNTILKKFSLTSLAALLILVFATAPAYAIDLAGPRKQRANNELIPQIKAITGIGLGVATVFLIALLIFKLVTLYTAYRRGEEFHIRPIILIVVGIIVAGTGTVWMWGILG